jgi:hypothetical protein
MIYAYKYIHTYIIKLWEDSNDIYMLCVDTHDTHDGGVPNTGALCHSLALPCNAGGLRVAFVALLVQNEVISF